MKYLVTGGAGFIGSNIVEKLLKSGNFVRVVDNFSTGRKENIRDFLSHKNFELLKADISNLENCRKAVEGVDFILHQAAINSVPRSIDNPLAPNKANIVGTLNLLVAAKEYGKIKKFVYASSSSVYGDSIKLPKCEDDPINPISPYSLTKFSGERYCQLFYKYYNLPTICLRYFNVFGPRQNPHSEYSAVIPKFIKSILNNERPIIHGDGNQTRDFTFIDNVVGANLLAVKSKISGEVINIACGRQISLNNLLESINDLTGKKIIPIYSDSRRGDVRNTIADISKAQKMLNYKPKAELEYELKKTIEWFKKNEL